MPAIEHNNPREANASGININDCWSAANVCMAVKLIVDAIVRLAIIEPQ